MRAGHPVEMTGNIRTNLICGTLTFSTWSSCSAGGSLCGRRKDEKYYTCFRDYCERWISDNADGKGDGWHPYTISLRLTNLWICLDGFEGRVQEDQVFFLKLTDSMYAQYLHLQKKLELHLLGNHYLENLKGSHAGSPVF